MGIFLLINLLYYLFDYWQIKHLVKLKKIMTSLVKMVNDIIIKWDILCYLTSQINYLGSIYPPSYNLLNYIFLPRLHIYTPISYMLPPITYLPTFPLTNFLQLLPIIIQPTQVYLPTYSYLNFLLIYIKLVYNKMLNLKLNKKWTNNSVVDMMEHIRHGKFFECQRLQNNA